jgi:hypothetical protein
MIKLAWKAGQLSIQKDWQDRRMSTASFNLIFLQTNLQGRLQKSPPTPKNSYPKF